jgi:hypothetical protein
MGLYGYFLFNLRIDEKINNFDVKKTGKSGENEKIFMDRLKLILLCDDFITLTRKFSIQQPCTKTKSRFTFS